MKHLRSNAMAAAVAAFGTWSVLAQTTSRVNVATDGAQAIGWSGASSISVDGRFVAFASGASNLVPSDTNARTDIFVHDRETGQTSMVSVATGGAQGNGGSDWPSITSDGRFVAFQSTASNLVPGDTNSVPDIFVHDRQTGETSRVSVATGGDQGNWNSERASISGDGRFVAFWSSAGNLVPGDTNGYRDVFVHDRQTGQTSIVSVAIGGALGDYRSELASISGDGRFVAFQSAASNLVPGDTNNAWDVFVRDRNMGETSRVSVATGGAQGDGVSEQPSISADGRFVVFHSWASTLVPGDTNSLPDVFVHDRQTGQTSIVSVATCGSQGNSWSFWPAISADGLRVAFHSDASNLVAGDTKEIQDVFLHDRQTGTTTRVSVSTGGAEGNGTSELPAISADGRFVAFQSVASNLVPNDTNLARDIFVHEREVPLLPCPGDANGDGVVDYGDITSVLVNWGGPGPAGDADHDCDVDFADITEVLTNQGVPCP